MVAEQIMEVERRKVDPFTGVSARRSPTLRKRGPGDRKR